MMFSPRSRAVGEGSIAVAFVHRVLRESWWIVTAGEYVDSRDRRNTILLEPVEGQFNQCR
jgi:hypothetical protein